MYKYISKFLIKNDNKKIFNGNNNVNNSDKNTNIDKSTGINHIFSKLKYLNQFDQKGRMPYQKNHNHKNK